MPRFILADNYHGTFDAITKFSYMNFLNKYFKILLDKNYNKFTLITVSSLFLIAVGFLDYFTGSEISLLSFYLFPIFFVAMHQNSNKKTIAVNTMIAGIIWFIAEYCSRLYSNNFIIIWNAFVRFTIFFTFGLLLNVLKIRYNKIKEINMQLVKLNDEKNKFIGIAAHDLKNPIGSISAISDLLLSDNLDKMDEETIEMLGYIKELSTNSMHILKNVLDVSKIESGIIEIKIKDQDYIEFVKKQIFFNQLLANKKEIKINFETNETKLFFRFDEHYLSEVVNNLLTNAIKFSHNNATIRVKISVDDMVVKTEIIDTGKGIPPQEHSKLFKYFQKTSTLPTAGEISTGLGLAISKKIIIEHKGTIGFSSEPQKGSNFYFELNTES